MSEPKTSGSVTVIATALFADGAVAVAKFVAAFFSGSAAMFSEGLHSLADAATAGLLLAGRISSLRAPDEEHPFGYGKERFFWAFVVSLLIFFSGGIFSVSRGLRQIQNPQPLSHLEWNLLILAVAFCLDGFSWLVARRELRGSTGHPVWTAIRESKKPSVMTVFLEDSAGLIGVGIAGLGTAMVYRTQLWMIDGVVSICIGAVLFAAAFIIASKTRSLLIGESASREVLQAIRNIVGSTEEVERLVVLLTMHLGPEELLINLELQFKDGMTTGEIEHAIDRIEQGIKSVIPGSAKIFIEVESASSQG